MGAAWLLAVGKKRRKDPAPCPTLRILSVWPDGNSGWNALTPHRDSLPTLRVDLPSREV
jgi:hypothetical protein